MILILLLCAVLAYWVYKETQNPDKFPPGPPKMPVLGSIPFIPGAETQVYPECYLWYFLDYKISMRFFSH